jgi:septum formation protein
MFYLASQSPRRRELLESMGLAFSIVRPDIDESTKESESPREAVERLAGEKVEAGVDIVHDRCLPFHPVVAADTVVVTHGTALGKPASAEEAFSMMSRLSGRTHCVLTAVAIHDGTGVRRKTSESFVTMKSLSRWEMERYWATGEPRDKAGGYAIQGLGAGFVTRLEGSYSGVVGLPLYETRELLATAGIDWL